ncbi:hypothetical protein GWK47_046903 [Chionoecetes opilio]|uniref:Uncharacterized protein n=1 Tax=Chionoecetes opilio TaxID=41210 RepID=A0A8J4YH48_CHIOP|nr:hypothetical protein GWK47_046903 [Chionoecetes opilio]
MDMGDGGPKDGIEHELRGEASPRRSGKCGTRGYPKGSRMRQKKFPLWRTGKPHRLPQREDDAQFPFGSREARIRLGEKSGAGLKGWTKRASGTRSCLRFDTRLQTGMGKGRWKHGGLVGFRHPMNASK